MNFKKLTAILLVVCMLATFMPTAFATTQNFRDFPTGWSKEAMTAAVNNGLLVGVNATEIRPTANLTRAELATIVVRAFGAKTKADISAFTDVPENSWYYDYIAKAVKMEALNGKSESSMDPLSPITREEVFTVLSRILVLESDNSSVLSKFKDSASVSDWAVKGISALVEKGYVNGDDLGKLNPKANITREEFAQFMHNMIKVYITTPGIYTEDLEGITVLRVGGVTLRNLKNTNDLVAGDGVMTDDVKIEDVEIEGRLLTRGGVFTIKRTTVSENVVVKNVNGIVHFNNYRDEKVFEGINEITKATFLNRATGSTGGYTPSAEKATYTVKHIRENLDGTYDVLYEEETKTGVVGRKTEAVAKSYTGFKALSFSQAEILEDGSTVVEIRYQRNTHKVTFKLDNGDGDIVRTNVKYGTKIYDIVPAGFTKEHWAFAGWKNLADGTVIGSDATLGDADAIYEAQWSQTEAQYTIKHIRQGLNGSYAEVADLYEAEYKIGEIGEDTEATAKTYEGFTALSFSQAEVLADGSTVVTIKYERNKYDVTFKLDNGASDVVISDVYYGALLKDILPTGLTKHNYEFTGWYPAIDDDTVLGSDDVTYVAQWNKTNSDYVVKHIRENLDGTYDVLYEEETLNGKIGEETKAVAKTYTGFTPLAFTQTVIPATDDLVVEIKYERNTYSVTFKLGNGEADVVVYGVKYGDRVKPYAPTGFTKPGYVCIGWSPAIDDNTVLGSSDVEYTAVWVEGDATYTVRHIRENLDGTYDVLSEEELKGGVTGQQTEAVAKTYEGFTALSFVQKDILADGSTVVEIRYQRNTYKVTFVLNNGDADVVVDNVKYGTFVQTIAPTGFTKTDYEFDKWNPEIASDTTLGAADATYEAQWKLTQVNYTVKFIYEALGIAQPEIVTEVKKGIVGNDIVIYAPDKEGFTPDAAYKTVTVKEDGTAIVEFYYTRNTHDVTFKLDNGDADVVISDVKYGTLIADIIPAAPTKQGYVFDGWVPAIAADATLGDAPETYTATWVPGDTNYTVKHIRENLDGTYDVLYEEEVLVGTTEEKTNAQAKDYEGFTALSFSQEDVLADGSTVVTIKYERNKYDVTFKLDNGDADVVISDVKYGTLIADIIPAAPTKQGYVFDGWDPEVTADKTLGDATETYTATWVPGDSNYTVKHIRETLDGNFDETIADLYEEEVLVGTTEEKTNAQAKDYEGFEALSFSQVDILPDGSAVVVIMYARKTYDITFKLGNGEADVVVSDVKYGASIKPYAPTGITKPGYVFDGWNPAIDDSTVLGASDVEYTAVWVEGNATYTVKHIRETLDGNFDETISDLYEEEVIDGITGEETAATAKTYEGFTAISFSQVEVLPDNSAVVVIKYKRNVNTLTFILDNGQANVVYDVKYGEKIAPYAPTGFTKEGSVFEKWNPEFDDATEMPDEAVVYTALWIPENVTVRFVVGQYGNPYVLDTLTLKYGDSVEKTVIDGQPVYSTSLYSYQKKASYAPFYNNETHETYSEYWYINDAGEWELFDENVVVKRDIDVYAWYSYLKIQLTVPQLTSLSPPLLATYTPDKTRIIDTAKDMLFSANNVWIKNFVTEDKYIELREKAFAKVAKTGVIDEYGKILITQLPVKITSVIEPAEIHKEVKKYIRGIITNESKLDQIFGMVTPAELINMIGVEELIGMLTNQQIADVINGMATDEVVDLIIGYPDVKDIVVDALKTLIKPDANGNVSNVQLRNRVIAQIEHQLANDQTIRAHILGDLALLDWVLTSFRTDIEHMAVNDDTFIKSILANDAIRVSMIESLLANPAFIDVLKNNATLKQEVLSAIKSGETADKILAMLDANSGNDDFKKAILDEVKGNAGLLGTLSSSMSDSLLNSMNGFGTSADLKAYVLYAIKNYYGILPNDYSGTDYSDLIDDQMIQDKIAEAEAEIYGNDELKEYVLDIVKDYYGVSSSYNGTDYSDIIPVANINNKIVEVENNIKNSSLKEYVLDVVKCYYGLMSDYTGEDYSDIIPSNEIEDMINDAEAEIRNSTIKEYVLDIVRVYYGATPSYSGTDYSDVISVSDVHGMIADAEAELNNPELKDYVIYKVNESYGIDIGYAGEDYSTVISDSRIDTIINDLESEIRGTYPGISDTDLQNAVLQVLEDSWDDILDEFVAEEVLAAVDNGFEDALDERIGDAVVSAIENDWNTILDEYLADAVISAVDEQWNDILTEYINDAVVIVIDEKWNDLFGDVSDTDSIAYQVQEYKNGAVDAFVNNNGDLSGTDYAAVQDMIDDAIISLVYDFVNGASFDSDVEDLIADVMMDFAMQDINSVTNPDIKELLQTAQNTFKAKAKELSVDTIFDAFVSYRDEDDANVAVIEQAIDANYNSIVSFVEGSLFDDEGNPDTNSEIYKTIDKLLSEKAESIPYDTFAELLNMLLEDDSDLITDYFDDFVENPDNREIVEEQVEAYIAGGNINATFVADHRAQIESAILNEGIDISAYVTVDVIKSYINGLGDYDAKVAFADKVYEALEQVPEFKEFMDSFDNKKDTFKIHKNNTLFVMGIAEAIKGFEYDEIIGMVRGKLPANNIIDKAIDLFGDVLLKDMFKEAQDDYYQGIADIVAEIQADEIAGVEPKIYDYPTSLTFKVNLVETLKAMYDRATTKAFALLDSKGVDYTSNPYLNYLMTNNYIDEIIYDTGMGEYDNFTGYELKDETEYAEMVVKYAILIDDAICWYGVAYTEEQRDAILSAVINKAFGLHDKLNELLTEYRATGDLPAKAESVISGVQQVNAMFTKFQPKLDQFIDKYLASGLNKHFDASDVLDNDKVQSGLDFILGTEDEPVFTIDTLYELFYRFDDKTQEKLTQLINSGKLEKAVKKFEETDLVELIGKFSDNSKVTSLAQKAQEIKESGRVKSAFNSVYDLLVLIAEHGIDIFRTDEDVINVIDAYEVSIKGVKFKISRELNN